MRKIDDEKKELFIVQGMPDVLDAMKRIGDTAEGIIYIVDEEKRLIASVTDGDIRRYIIKVGNLKGNINECMNRNPICCGLDEEEKAADVMKKNGIRSLPVLDAEHHIRMIIFLDDKAASKKDAGRGTLSSVPIVIMAGGKGSRLMPYTNILPKPLIPIGGIPILERIMDCFFEQGGKRFYVILNYKKGMIQSYFSETSKEYELLFREEDKPLGTAGGLRLIKDQVSGHAIITNCDILVDCDFEDAYEFHLSNKNDITIIASVKNIEIPYGVLHTKEDGILTSVEEKPRLSYLINTGVYIVNTKWFDVIPADVVYHMTDFVEDVMKKDGRVAMYPIRENAFWDMGEFEELSRMEERFSKE